MYTATVLMWPLVFTVKAVHSKLQVSNRRCELDMWHALRHHVIGALPKVRSTYLAMLHQLPSTYNQAYDHIEVQAQASEHVSSSTCSKTEHIDIMLLPSCNNDEHNIRQPLHSSC